MQKRPFEPSTTSQLPALTTGLFLAVLKVKPRASCTLAKHSSTKLHPQPLAFVLNAGQKWLEGNTSWEVVALKTNWGQGKIPGITAPPSCHAEYILFDTGPCHISRKPTCKYYTALALLDFFFSLEIGSHCAVQPGLWTFCSPVCPWPSDPLASASWLLG